MPHRYNGERPNVQVNYTYGAGGSINSGQQEEEPTMWVPIEIKRDGSSDEHWARKKKAAYYKSGANAVYSTGAGGSIQTGETVQHSAARPRNVPIEVNRCQPAPAANEDDQGWPRKRRSDLKPAF